jgi:hypothetical protein
MKFQTRHLLVVLFVVALSTANASACPFCTAVKSTLSQRREAATVVAIAECLESAPQQATFRVHELLKGEQVPTENLRISLDAQLKPGSLAILFGDGAPENLAWSCEPASELGLSYFVKAPTLRKPSAERLPYFVRFLEHADPLAAQDAFNEFGHAPYDAVQQVAELFPADQLRAWLADPGVRDERKGFYGLALGLAGRIKDRPAQEAFLRQQIEKPADDFRAGFDGILGGYLILAGEAGLEVVEQRILADPRARVGDVRHAMSSLRFYQEFGREIPTPRLARALRHVLGRPEFAAAAIIDLARWRDWNALPEVVALYGTDPLPEAATRRAIVGYLLNCPAPQASTELAKLRRKDPQGVAEAERAVPLSAGGAPTN